MTLMHAMEHISPSGTFENLKAWSLELESAQKQIGTLRDPRDGSDGGFRGEGKAASHGHQRVVACKKWLPVSWDLRALWNHCMETGDSCGTGT